MFFLNRNVYYILIYFFLRIIITNNKLMHQFFEDFRKYKKEKNRPKVVDQEVSQTKIWK